MKLDEIIKIIHLGVQAWSLHVRIRDSGLVSLVQRSGITVLPVSSLTQLIIKSWTPGQVKKNKK